MEWAAGAIAPWEHLEEETWHVPIKGVKRDNLHLINKQIALRHLAVRTLKFFRLALASKPYDVFFLCHVPSQNLDNEWNATSLRACEQAKEFWTRATSRKADGVEGYKIDFARNPAAFPSPNWPKPSLNELIAITFAGLMIMTEDHPGLLRLVGDVQSTS